MYEIVRGNDANEVREAVNALERNGYVPVGGIAFRQDDTLFQAMIKTDRVAEPASSVEPAKTKPTYEELGKIAFEAYCEEIKESARYHFSWGTIPEEARRSWSSAAAHIVWATSRK